MIANKKSWHPTTDRSPIAFGPVLAYLATALLGQAPYAG